MKLAYFIVIFVVGVPLLYSCNKDTGKKDCGCDTTNFRIVKDKSGLLVYKEGVWVLANDKSQFPSFLGIICNKDGQVIKDFVGDHPPDSIAVLFSGKESKPCLKQGAARLLSADFYAFNITIDSIKLRKN